MFREAKKRPSEANQPDLPSSAAALSGPKVTFDLSVEQLPLSAEQLSLSAEQLSLAEENARLRAALAEKDQALEEKDQALAASKQIIEENERALEEITEKWQRSEEQIKELRDELKKTRDEEQANRAATNIAPGVATARDLLRDKKLSTAYALPKWGDIVRSESSKRLKLSSTGVSANWMPFVPENAKEWPRAEFIKHLKTAEERHVLVDGQRVPLLSVILDAKPDSYTASKLVGTYLAKLLQNMNILHENTVENLLLRGLWDPLEMVMGSQEQVAQHIEMKIMPGQSVLVLTDPQFAGLYRVDDTIDVRIVNNGATELKQGCLGDIQSLTGTATGDAPATGNIGCVTVEVKLDVTCPIQAQTNDEKNNLLSGSLDRYARSGLPNVLTHNPLAQIATYLLLQRMVFGVVTTLNQTSFVKMDLSTDKWAVLTSEKFDATTENPLGNGWSLFEIWIRFILMSIGQSRVNKVPDLVKEHFQKIWNDVQAKKEKKASEEEEKKANQNKKDSKTSSSTGKSAGGATLADGNGGGGAGAEEAATQSFSLSYADLFDHRRFALAHEGVPPEVEFSPAPLEGDAELIAEGRVGRVFRKTIRNVDAVVKVLVLTLKRDELDGMKDVVPTKIVDELAREEEAYTLLDDLQGSVVPRFLGRGQVLGGAVHMFATEYAGEPLPDEISLSMANKMRAALSTLHDRGMAHGDVALRNFLRRGDEVVILDFGLCTFQEEVIGVGKWEAMVEKEKSELEALLPNMVLQREKEGAKQVQVAIKRSQEMAGIVR